MPTMTAVDDRPRITPLGEPMHRIPADDELRGMFEGSCMSCMAVTAEWRSEDGGWQECDACADIEGEDAINEAKRAVNRARTGLRRHDLTPMGRMVLERVLERAERHLEALRTRAG